MQSIDPAGFPSVRLRRLRQHPGLRDMLSEHTLRVHDLVLPLFIREGQGIRHPIASMPGHFQFSVDQLHDELLHIQQLGIPAVMLFGIPGYKDEMGSAALDSQGVIPTAIQCIKNMLPNLLIITDLCFCEYTSHGHCGVLIHRQVDNDLSLEHLARQAIVHAQAGADMIAPSGMMDGIISTLRVALDAAGFNQLPLLSYAVKYASALYGPFREAAEGAPTFGDRKTYQMNPANTNEALREAALDVQEGADILMVKPALSYLDVIYRVKQAFPSVPLAAYQVSGEFAMLKAAAQNGWINEDQAMMESLISIKRAGADFILTYFAKQAAALLSE